MATAVIMPKQGQSVETCIITKWFKSKGEKVAVGDILLSYETDKASFDLECPAEGILLDVFFSDGAEVPVLVNVAVIGKNGETTDSFNPNSSAPRASMANLTSDVREASQSVVGLKVLYTEDNKIRISPRAKSMAEDKGLNYKDMQGSGPNGRIIARDIEKMHNEGKAVKNVLQNDDAEYTEKHLSNVRKLIGRAMHSS